MYLAQIHLIVIASHAEYSTWRLVEAENISAAEYKVRKEFENMEGTENIAVFIHKTI